MYSRNRLYISPEEQDRLGSLRLLLGGAGLGSEIAECALRLGIRHIHIIDGDRVEQSNLNRQNYVLSDVGRLKAEVLSERLKAIAPDAEIEFTPVYLTEENLTTYALDCDVAVNALDFSTSVPFLFDCYYVGKNIPMLHPYNFGWIGCVFVIRTLTSEWLKWEQFEGKTEVAVARFVMSRLEKKTDEWDAFAKVVDAYENEKETLEHLILQMEKERGLDRSAAIADMRFNFIERICESTVVKPKESRERIRSQKIDRILTGKYTAIPCFVMIMLAVFYLTFNVIGAFLQDILQLGIDRLTAMTDQALSAAKVNEVLHGLVIDGIFAGVGSVLSFLPIIVTLFFFLSIMEDSGYIARVAFFMDKLLRKIGLSGRSIVPLLIGFGCTVPAVMATRTLPSERDRKMTILLTPFMSCSAKLPIYSFFVSAFFPKKGGLIMAGLYFLGILIGICVALIYRKTLFHGDAVPFVMELPNYRMPGMRNVVQLLWEKAKDFIQRAFTVILIATICIWCLQSFDIHFNLVKDSKDSILAAISGILVPLFQPLGLGDWRICTSLISGFMAKESVVSSLQILFGNSVTTAISSLGAASLLVFSLLYTPCVAAIASIRREMGRKWAVGVVFFQCAVAWAAAWIVSLIGTMMI